METLDQVKAELLNFKKDIDARNRFYTCMNEITPKVSELLNNHSKNLVDEELIKMLPKVDTISYHISYENHFIIRYEDKIEPNFIESITMYYGIFDGYIYPTYTLIDFDEEYKKATEYFNAYVKSLETLKELNMNMYFKEYLLRKMIPLRLAIW